MHPAHQLHCPSLGGHTIDFSIIAFKTPACFQLPTPRCHCSAAAELTDKWDELARDTNNLHQTRKDKWKETRNVGMTLTETFRHHHRWLTVQPELFLPLSGNCDKAALKSSWILLFHLRLYLHHFSLVFMDSRHHFSAAAKALRFKNSNLLQCWSSVRDHVQVHFLMCARKSICSVHTSKQKCPPCSDR